MSWLYSQVLVAEYSEANSLAGAPSALSSASPTPQAYSSLDRMTAFSRLSRFGMTFAPLTESLGADLLTWFLAGFPAKTSARQEKERALTETRSGLWKEMARIVGQVGPRYVFIENSPMLRTRGLHVVLKDLAEMGYDARWGVLGAVDAGAPHKRDRIWIVAERHE
jgi:hypothetical protein